MTKEEKKEKFHKAYQNIIQDNTPSAAEMISNALNDEETMKETASLLKRIVDGEPVNKNPLAEIPDSEMMLYGINGTYFDTKEDLISYCESKDISIDNAYILEYIRNVAGRSDVIRRTSTDGKSLFYTAVDENGYGIYNHERSVYRGEFIWEFNYGHIRGICTPFRDRGIVFENDVYDKIDTREKNLIRMFRGKNHNS